MKQDTGSESHHVTGEPHAPAEAVPDNAQGFTVCFAVDYLKDEDHTIERPEQFDFWKHYVPALTPPWPGPLLSLSYSQPVTLEPVNPVLVPHDDTNSVQRPNLWTYRRILARAQLNPGSVASDVCLINWPMNDYWLGDLCTCLPHERSKTIDAAKQLSLSLLYWLQTECDLRGLRLRPDLMDTLDGLAKSPYVRESRRLKAMVAVCEQQLSPEVRERAEPFEYSVGIGYYRIDLHPSIGGNNYVDIGCLQFQIPLGALIPQRVENLLPACKNIGTTHITNGCFRLHPVEWSIGEAAGALPVYCLKTRSIPRQVYLDEVKRLEFQQTLIDYGVELEWPNDIHDKALSLHREVTPTRRINSWHRT